MRLGVFLAIILTGCTNPSQPSQPSPTAAAPTPLSPSPSPTQQPSPSPATTPVPTPEIADKWQRNEKVSEWDDSRSVTFTLASEGPAAGTGGNERSVTLVVFCKGKAKLTTFGLLGIQPESDIDNGVVVNLRFDKTPAVSQRWGLAPIEQEGFSVTQAQAIANMKRLAASSTLLVGFSPMLGRQQTARFDVRGFNRHIKEIATACGWSP